MSHKYYLAIDKEQRGPFAEEQLLAAGLQWDTPVWFLGLARWTPAREVPEVRAILSAAAIADPGEADSYEPSAPPRPEFHSTYIDSTFRRANLFCGYTIGLVVGAIACWTMSLLGGRDESTYAMLQKLAGISLGLANLLALVFVIFFLLFIYRAWAILQDGRAPIAPGRAVGFLFIPVFQYYWMFVAVAGLATEVNRFTDRHRLVAPRASILLGRALAIYWLTTWIPYVGIVSAFLVLCLMARYMKSLHSALRCCCQDVSEDLPEEAHTPRKMATSAARFFAAIAMWLPVVGIVLLAAGLISIPELGADLAVNAEKLRHAQPAALALGAVGILCFPAAGCCCFMAAHCNAQMERNDAPAYGKRRS